MEKDRSAFHLPEERAVRRELAPAAEVVLLAGDEVPGQAAARVEMGVILGPVRVDGDQDPFAVAAAFEDDLLDRKSVV